MSRSLARQRPRLEDELEHRVRRLRPRAWFSGRWAPTVGASVNTWPDLGTRRFPHNTSGSPPRHSRGSTTTGRPGVRFDGSNDRMDPAAGFAHAGTSHTLILVLDATPPPGDLEYYLDASSGRLIFAQAGGALRTPAFYDGSAFDQASTSKAGVQILEFLLADPTDGFGKIILDGVAVASATYTPTALNGTVRWFSHNNGSAFYPEALAHEMIYFDRALHRRDLRALRPLLARMYGIRNLGDA